jgi:Acetyltransferases, including N-acetylases of ribosomal proteins
MSAPWTTPPRGSAAQLAGRLAAALPRLQTPRLTLRAPQIADGAAYDVIYRSDRWPHPDGLPDAEAAWLDFNSLVASWLLRGYGSWAIEDRARGDLLGFAILHHEFGDPEPEIGWAPLPEAEGRGIATEAAAAILAHARTIGIAPVAYVDPGNPRSSSVARRIGGHQDAAAEDGIGGAAEVWRFAEGAA